MYLRQCFEATAGLKEYLESEQLKGMLAKMATRSADLRSMASPALKPSISEASLTGMSKSTVSMASNSLPSASPQVRALYDFAAENAGEMSISKGEMLTVTKSDDSGWWSGVNASGDSGLFPANYVEKADGGISRSHSSLLRKSSELPVLPGYGAAPSQRKPEAKSELAPCVTCSCSEFAPNMFKKGQCNNCFHQHS